MKPRHVPARLCLGCNVSDERPALRRFHADAGGLVWTSAGAYRGRGGYLHLREECLRAFTKRKPFLRSLRASFAPAVRARLVAEAAEG